MKTTKSRSEASLAAAPTQYSSTPHLFVFQSADEPAGLLKPDPVYQSAAEMRLSAAQAITERYDSLRSLAPREDDQLLVVGDADVAQVESFFAGHKTQVIVCRALANMYLSSESHSWELKYTGIPALVVDADNTRSSSAGRLVQLVLAEKGTGFMLWRDRVDAMSAYAAPDPSFHTMNLSSNRQQRVGLSFDDTEAAKAFQSHVTSVSAELAAAGAAAQAQKRRRKRARAARPRKEDISQPCCFQHVTSVSLRDMDRFYTLQSLVGGGIR